VLPETGNSCRSRRMRLKAVVDEPATTMRT
jgi:hypothetical protein